MQKKSKSSKTIAVLPHNLPERAWQDFFTQLLAQGYSDQLVAYTSSIASNPLAVLRFARTFAHLAPEMVPLPVGASDHAPVVTPRDSWAGTEQQERAIRQVVASIDGLERMFGEAFYEQSLFLNVICHGLVSTLEIGWQDVRAGRVVWDVLPLDLDDPVMLFADLSRMFDEVDYSCVAQPAAVPLPALYRYHPERFKAYRNYADEVGKMFRHTIDPASGITTEAQYNQLARLLMADVNPRAMAFPRRYKDGHPAPSLVLHAESTLAMAYGRFVQAGRQIMDFPPALVAMLAKTGIDDISMDQISMPYRAQYIYFGPQTDLELEPGHVVDGAYVESRGEQGDIRFTVTTVPLDTSKSQDWYLFPEVLYSQDFVGEYRHMDLASAIDTVLAENLNLLQQTEDKAGGNITATVKQHFEQEQIDFPDGLTMVDLSPTLASERIGIIRRRHPVYCAALQLVVNALCYLTAYPDDITSTWPKSAPVELVRLVLEGSGKEVQRAKSKLAALGYVPVHVCGTHVAQMRELEQRIGQQHGVHWRRGHWRRQAHGPARALRKLIWVMPVMVGLKPGEEPETGHLYLVS